MAGFREKKKPAAPMQLDIDNVLRLLAARLGLPRGAPNSSDGWRCSNLSIGCQVRTFNGPKITQSAGSGGARNVVFVAFDAIRHAAHFGFMSLRLRLKRCSI